MNEKELREDFQRQGYSDYQIDLMLGSEKGLFDNIEEMPSRAVPDSGKPYPGEHACRLQNPAKYSRFARRNCFRRSAGKCVDYIFGIKGNKAETQAMRYKTSAGWTASAAAAHCREAGGTFEEASGE